jgi:hypothetical protein
LSIRSDPGFVNPFRSGFCQSVPIRVLSIRSDPFRSVPIRSDPFRSVPIRSDPGFADAGVNHNLVTIPRMLLKAHVFPRTMCLFYVFSRPCYQLPGAEPSLERQSFTCIFQVVESLPICSVLYILKSHAMLGK